MSEKEQRLNSQDSDSENVDTQNLNTQRRDFLRGSIAAATGVAVTVATASSSASIAETTVTREPDKKDGYRLTEHISNYYKSAAI